MAKIVRLDIYATEDLDAAIGLQGEEVLVISPNADIEAMILEMPKRIADRLRGAEEVDDRTQEAV